MPAVATGSLGCCRYLPCHRCSSTGFADAMNVSMGEIGKPKSRSTNLGRAGLLPPPLVASAWWRSMSERRMKMPCRCHLVSSLASVLFSSRLLQSGQPVKFLFYFRRDLARSTLSRVETTSSKPDGNSNHTNTSITKQITNNYNYRIQRPTPTIRKNKQPPSQQNKQP